MEAIVIGGGIGGAATACALLCEGVEVELYEQAEQFGEIGAGLQISANAVRVLEHLGVGAALREVGVAAEAVEFRDLHTDELLHHTSLGGTELNRLGAQFIQAQRPDLLDILVRRLPGAIVRSRLRPVRLPGRGVQRRCTPRRLRASRHGLPLIATATAAAR